MKARTWLVAAALGGLVAASPAVANHAPYYLWMGVIDISSTAGGTNVSYSFSGFGPGPNWSGGCVVTTPWNGSTTSVSCTPPAPPAPFDVNYCGAISTTVSSTAPAVPGVTVTGTSSCASPMAIATATTPAPGVNGSGGVALGRNGITAPFPWVCKADASALAHPWTVHCTVSH